LQIESFGRLGYRIVVQIDEMCFACHL